MMKSFCKARHGWLGLVVSGALALAPSMAAAVTTASASVTDLEFTLVDLDPGRAVAPSLSWVSSFTSVQATRDYGELVTLLPQADGSVQWSVSYTGKAVVEGNTAEALLQALGAQVQGATASTGAGSLSAQVGTAQGKASLFGFALASGDFLLSAMTELHVTARLNAATGGPGSNGFVAPAGASADVAVPFSQGYGYAELFLDGNSVLATVNGVSYTPNANPASYPVSAYLDAQEKSVELIFRNESASEVGASFYALVQASGAEITSAVPEPSQWLLMVLGLGLVGRAAQRRARAY